MEMDRKCFEVNSYTRTSKKNLSSNAFGCFEVLRSSETHLKYNFGPNNCIVCVCVCVGGLNAGRHKVTHLMH